MTIRQAYEAIARDQLRKHDIQLTEANMEFDEWWAESGAVNYSACVMNEFVMKEFVRIACAAATAAERERCARIAEGAELPGDRHWIKGSLYDMLRRDIAAEIWGKP